MYPQHMPMGAYTAPAPLPVYAHGGRVRKATLTLAHMSPHELNILDHLQGGTERHNKSGVRSYSHLEELLKNPHIRANVHHHAREHHAMGGDADMSHAEVQHLAHYGRGGDTEMALIGPHTHHLFNAMAGYSTRNPHDGHPEYFSLKGALSGLMKGIKGVGSTVMKGVKAAAPTLGAIGRAALPAVSNIVQDKFGDKMGGLGGVLGQLGSGLAGAAFDKMAGPGQHTFGDAIGQGIGNFATAKHQGLSNREAIGQGIAGAGTNMGSDSHLGGILQNVGQGIHSGQSARDMFNANAVPAFTGALSGLGSAHEAYSQARKSGQGLSEALQSGARGGLQNLTHSQNAQDNLNNFAELPGMYEG